MILINKEYTMKKDVLKPNFRMLFLLLAATAMGVSRLNAAQDAHKMRQVAQLIERLGPEKAGDFIHRLEEKHVKSEPISRHAPEPIQPVQKQQLPESQINEASLDKVNPAPVHIPAQPTQPIQPVVKQETWIVDQEKADFNQIISTLQAYILKVYTCVEAFLNKNNSEPYRTHVGCFKTQLKFVQDALFQQFPQAKTPEGTKLFAAIQEIAKALEKTQQLMCQTLDRDYKKTWVPAKALGDELDKLNTPINQQRAIIDRQIGILRNALRKAQEKEMLDRLNKLYLMINKTFDYGNSKSRLELGMVLIHRLKR